MSHLKKPLSSRATKKQKAEKPMYEDILLSGRSISWQSTTDVHMLTRVYGFVDSKTKIPCPYLPRILAYLRDPGGELMPYELWSALVKRVVTGLDDVRLKDRNFAEGYELAFRWEAVARLLQYRACRDAAKARQMLVYVQAVDRCIDCMNVGKVDYLRALCIVNHCTTGNRAGILPLFIGMRVRLTRKINATKKVGERESWHGCRLLLR